jgi:hypothetical protein
MALLSCGGTCSETVLDQHAAIGLEGGDGFIGPVRRIQRAGMAEQFGQHLIERAQRLAGRERSGVHAVLERVFKAVAIVDQPGGHGLGLVQVQHGAPGGHGQAGRIRSLAMATMKSSSG